MKSSIKSFLTLFSKFSFAIFVVYIIGNTDCRDPYDFAPGVDTLVFPPLAPRLLDPPDSFVFFTDTNEVYFTLYWGPVDSAQMYVLDLHISGQGAIVLRDSTSYLGLIDAGHFGENTWRIRAGSARWKGGYTDWSALRVFYTRRRPAF